MCTTSHLSNINLLQLHLGQLCVCGMLVAGARETGAGLRLEEIQEGCIAVRPPIQAAEICGTCTTTSSSLIYLPGLAGVWADGRGASYRIIFALTFD